MSKSFNLFDRLKSFKFAWTGIRTMLKTQHNAWIHFASTIAIIAVGFFFRITVIEWCLVALAIMVVWCAEALNTAFEFLADVASPEFHPLVEKAKDVAAGAVLISAAGSVIIAIIIFYPYLNSLFG